MMIHLNLSAFFHARVTIETRIVKLDREHGITVSMTSGVIIT